MLFKVQTQPPKPNMWTCFNTLEDYQIWPKSPPSPNCAFGFVVLIFFNYSIAK